MRILGRIDKSAFDNCNSVICHHALRAHSDTGGEICFDFSGQMLSALQHRSARLGDQNVRRKLCHESAAAASTVDVEEQLGPESFAVAGNRAPVVVNESGTCEQRIGELDLRFREAAPNRADWNSENCRDFVVRIVAPEVSEHRGNTERLGQSLECMMDPLAQFQSFDPIFGCFPIVGGLGKNFREHFATTAAILQANPAKHGDEPAGDRIGIADAANVPQRNQTRLLNRVLGVGAVAELAERGREEARPVTLQEHGKRGGVAGPRGNCQLSVAE